MELADSIPIGRDNRDFVPKEELPYVQAVTADSHKLVPLSHVVESFGVDLLVCSQERWRWVAGASPAEFAEGSRFELVVP